MRINTLDMCFGKEHIYYMYLVTHKMGLMRGKQTKFIIGACLTVKKISETTRQNLLIVQNC